MKPTKILSLILLVLLILAGCGSQPTGENQGDQIGLANPASVYCEEQRARLEMREDANGTYGVCIFPDGSECEEWAYFRGECGPTSETTEAVEEPEAVDLASETGPLSIEVSALYGFVVSSNTDVPAESALVLTPEDFGSVFVTGETGEIEEQILSIRDKGEPNNHANFWGRLDCPTMETCLLTVTDIRLDGPGDFPVETIDGWEGVIYSGPPGPRSGGDDYFAILGPINFQYGIDSLDEGLRQQLETLRDTGLPIRIWGTLTAGIPDWNGSQIQVTKIEQIQASPSEIPNPPNW